MKNFTLINSIPTKTELPIFLDDKNLFFASENTLYNPEHVFNFQSNILSYSVSNYIFVQTFDHIYQINDKILSQLKIKKKVNLMKTDDKHLYIFYTNVLDIFNIPYKYQRPMYNLKNRIILDSAVKCACVYESYILIGDEDNRMYLLDYQNNKKYVLGSFVDEIVDVYLNNLDVTVVTKNCVYFYTIISKECGNEYQCETTTENVTDNNKENEVTQQKTNKKSYKRYFEQNEKTEQSNTHVQTYNEKSELINAQESASNINEIKNQILSFSLNKKIKLQDILASCTYKNTLFLAHINPEIDKYNISQVHNKEINIDTENCYDEIYSMSVHEDRIAIQLETFILIYNLKSNAIIQKYITNDITTYAYYKNHFFTADKKGLRIFNDKLTLVKEHEFINQGYTDKEINKKEKHDIKEDNTNKVTKYTKTSDERRSYRSITRINNCFAKKDILLTISTLSTVKVYNYNNFYCFKSFKIPHSVVTAETNDDISLLFIANERIYVYDVKRGKCIDELNYHKGTIVKMKCNDQYLYSLSVDNLFIKQNIYDTKKAHVIAENEGDKTIMDFCVQKNVYLLKNQEVTIFDSELNILKIISLKDEKKLLMKKYVL